jgi:hypothetical protein
VVATIVESGPTRLTVAPLIGTSPPGKVRNPVPLTVPRQLPMSARVTVLLNGVGVSTSSTTATVSASIAMSDTGTVGVDD